MGRVDCIGGTPVRSRRNSSIAARRFAVPAFQFDPPGQGDEDAPIATPVLG